MANLNTEVIVNVRVTLMVNGEYTGKRRLRLLMSVARVLGIPLNVWIET